MSGTRGEGRKSASNKANEASTALAASDQIEYLLFQSTQGVHFIFDKTDVSEILRRHDQDLDPSYSDQVQVLLTKLLERKTVVEKKSYVESLAKDDYELLVRAYFQLVDKTILANSNVRH